MDQICESFGASLLGFSLVHKINSVCVAEMSLDILCAEKLWGQRMEQKYVQFPLRNS